MAAAKRIIVIGGGFAGVQCARSLRHYFAPADYEIVLFSRENHMVFYPLLAEVAAAAMNPKDMAAPLRQLLKSVHCRTEDVTTIELDKNQILFENGDGEVMSMTYDQIVIASGNMTNLAFIPGMVDHALSLKSISDALKIQSHVISQLEKAEVATSTEKRNHCLTFVVVGGGFSGVELAGELNDFVKSSARFYSNFKAHDVEVILVHSHDQILPEVGSSLREFARQKMQEDGVKFYLNTSATTCTADGVRLKDGQMIKSNTVICTIGSRALPMIERLDLPKEKNRLVVNADMSVPGYLNAWAIGDCAAVKNAADGKDSPTTGQFAERQGAQVAKNMFQRSQGRETKPFSHVSLGTLCSIGGKSAVAEMFNIRISGFLAWFVWRGVYLLKLPSMSQRIKVAVNWAFDLVFPPELSAVPVDDTRKLAKAHYSAGDLLFKAGEPSISFYVVEEGEVEVFDIVDGKEKVVSVLGKGDFFGESSLISQSKHSHACRARTDCEIMVMGKSVFDEISENLTPFKKALAAGSSRRMMVMENYPEAAEAVHKLPLKDIVEPLIAKPMTGEHSLLSVIDAINQHKAECVYIVDEHEKLVGLVNLDDLMHWAERISAHPEKKGLRLKVKDLPLSAPVSICESDVTANAVSVMREHGFSRLPVLSKETKKIVGVLRMENIMDRILRQVAETGHPENGEPDKEKAAAITQDKSESKQVI